MADFQSSTKYAISPKTITQVEANLLQAVRPMSLSMQRLPIDRRLRTFDQRYESIKFDVETGIGFEHDVVGMPGVSEDMVMTPVNIPVAFFNKALSYDDYQREQADVASLTTRLNAHLDQLALRLDIYNYRGDINGKYGINSLATATPGTELDTPLDVGDTNSTVTTMEAAATQLKKSLKFNGIINSKPDVYCEMTTNLYTESGVKSTNEDFNARQAIRQVLRDNFGQGSDVFENPLLDATITIDSNGKHSVTYDGTSNIMIMYVRDPRIMKVLQSPLQIRQSPLDDTKGITLQPVIRNRRIDEETLGVLVETSATVS